MRRYIYNILILFLVKGFVTKNSNLLKKRRKIKLKGTCYMSDLIDPALKIAYGGDDEVKIRLLSNENTKLLLDMWTMNPEWETDEMKKMYLIANRDDPNDIFLGYCPKYNNKNRVLYIFLAKVVIAVTGKDKEEEGISIAYLSIISGVSCPFVKGYISSYEFKDLIQEVIPIMPIDYAPLLKNPKFGLSWKLNETK
jgi:hypothetical protein